MQSSDTPYKVLFKDPGLFEETVRLAAPELADALDFTTAASLDKEHLTASNLSRLQDQLRRVEFKAGALKDGRRPYVLVLLEFQSRHDPDMAWRMREYLHLVESDLREAGTLEREGALPPMLSVVVHNGEGHWRATTEYAGPLVGDGPPVRMPMYATVDLRALARGPDAQGRALAPGSRLATLAEVESARAGALPRLLLTAFQRYGGPDSAALRRGLHLRVEAALARRGMAAELPPLAEFERLLAQRRGGHMTAMLDATLERWEKAKIAEGVERGAAQGRVALLGQLAERRFGTSVADQLTALLADESDLSRLDEAGLWLVECHTGEALLARLKDGGRAVVDSAPLRRG